MVNGIGNLGWVFVLCCFAVLCGICWVRRTRPTATRGQYNGTQKPQCDRIVDELFQPEEEFDDVEDVIMVADEDEESEHETMPPVRRPVAQVTSQQETSVPSHTVQVNRKN